MPELNEIQKQLLIESMGSVNTGNVDLIPVDVKKQVLTLKIEQIQNECAERIAPFQDAIDALNQPEQIPVPVIAPDPAPEATAAQEDILQPVPEISPDAISPEQTQEWGA